MYLIYLWLNSGRFSVRRSTTTFKETNDKGETINRTEAIACLGGSSMTIEEEYFIVKLFRELGAVSLDNQARV
ncbi:MAG: hypothetical protein SOI38_05040 [Eggerthellaceae bacterium]|jgi:formate dehydrogenase major subunit